MLKKITTLVAVCAASSFVMGADDAVIQKIVIRGNKNINEEAIRAVMHSKEGEPYTEATLREDERAIRNMGFFKDAKVLAENLTDNEYEIIVDVEENPVISNFEVVGNTVVPTDAILNAIKQYQIYGQVYNLRNASPISTAVTNLYQDKGYFAQIDLMPKPDAPDTLEIKVIERTVNEIKFNGLVRTKPWVIERIIKTQSGKPFNRNTWNEDWRKLEATTWFESITPTGKESEEMGKLDLALDFKEAHTATLKFGASMAPSDLGGLAASFGYSDSNFLGRGQTFAATAQYSLRGMGLGGWNALSGSLDYINPFIDKHNTILSFSVYSRINNFFTTGPFGFGSDGPTPNANKEFNERRTGGSVSARRPLNKEQNLFAAAGLRFEAVNDLSPNNLPATLIGDYIQQNGSLLTLSGQMEYDGRDVPADPTKGHYAKILLEPAFGNLAYRNGIPSIISQLPLGGYSFLRSMAEYKYYLPVPIGKKAKALDAPKPVLAFRAQYGIITGNVPFYEQLFMGGSNTLRGFPEQRFWGNQSFLSSLEFRYPLQRTFSLFAFGDLGGAWGGYPGINRYNQTRDIRLYPSYGLGALFRSPLGPIQVSVGWGNPEGRAKYNLTVGYTF